MTNLSGVDGVTSAAVAENRLWFIVLGVVLILLGLAAIGAPLITTIAAKKFLGWLFLVAGISEVVHSFFARNWKGFIVDLLIGLLYACVGAWLAFFPLTGVIGLTLVLAITFMVEGVCKFAMGLQVRPLDGWMWVILSGVASIILGAMIFLGLPTSAAWAIGVLVGVNLLLSGLTFLAVALAAPSAS